MLPRRNMGTSNLFSLKKTWGLDISVPVDFCCYVTDLYSIKMAEINKKNHVPHIIIGLIFVQYVLCSWQASKNNRQKRLQFLAKDNFRTTAIK